jgi:hypothetical protein
MTIHHLITGSDYTNEGMRFWLNRDRPMRNQRFTDVFFPLTKSTVARDPWRRHPRTTPEPDSHAQYFRKMGSTRIVVDVEPMEGQLTSECRGTGTHPRSWRICGFGIAPMSDSWATNSPTRQKGPQKRSPRHGEAPRQSLEALTAIELRFPHGGQPSLPLGLFFCS